MLCGVVGRKGWWCCVLFWKTWVGMALEASCLMVKKGGVLAGKAGTGTGQADCRRGGGCWVGDVKGRLVARSGAAKMADGV